MTNEFRRANLLLFLVGCCSRGDKEPLSRPESKDEFLPAIAIAGVVLVVIDDDDDTEEIVVANETVETGLVMSVMFRSSSDAVATLLRRVSHSSSVESLSSSSKDILFLRLLLFIVGNCNSEGGKELNDADLRTENESFFVQEACERLLANVNLFILRIEVVVFVNVMVILTSFYLYENRQN